MKKDSKTERKKPRKVFQLNCTKKQKKKQKKNLKMSLTFAYFDFGILLLELASSS